MPRAHAEPGISTPHLLERDAELEALSGAVARVRDGTGGWLLIEGPAGVGKSRLLASARASAEEAGLPVLGARGAPLEREFAFGVARRLFEQPVGSASEEERQKLLAGAAGLSARLVGQEGPEVVAQDGDAAFGALHGLYWLTVNLADRGPLVLVVDDAHWADPPSLRFLGYLSRRLDGLPVLLLAAARVPDPESSRATRRLRCFARGRSAPGPPARFSGAGSDGRSTTSSAPRATGPPAAIRCSCASS